MSYWVINASAFAITATANAETASFPANTITDGVGFSADELEQALDDWHAIDPLQASVAITQPMYSVDIIRLVRLLLTRYADGSTSEAGSLRYTQWNSESPSLPDWAGIDLLSPEGVEANRLGSDDRKLQVGRAITEFEKFQVAP